MKRIVPTLTCALLALLVTSNINAASSHGLKTVVIDAGHGGKDPGAVSADKKTYEKSLTLDIALKLADRIRTAYPDVNVVLTRKDDIFVELDKRAKIANKANADLFISLHVNASVNKAPNGYSVHVLGESSRKNRDLFAANMEIVKRENAVISLEGDDFSEKYNGFNPSDPESFIFMQMMQNTHLEQSIQFAQIVAQKMGSSSLRKNNGVSQDPFLVLWKTSMPAVLVEMGYISNQDDLWTLRQAGNREKIADAIFQAFKTYKSQYDASLSRPSASASAPAAAAGVPAANSIADAAKTPAAASGATKKADAPSATNAASGTKTPAAASGSAKATSAAVATENASASKTAGSGATAAEGASATKYGVQVFAVSSRLQDSDARFMGYKPLAVKAGKVYKYVIGVSSSEEQARKNLAAIKKKYPDAFLVKVQGESIERVR